MQILQKKINSFRPKVHGIKKDLHPIAVSFTLTTIVGMVVCIGCTRPSPSGSRIAFTSILPQKDFVTRIAGDRFEVYTLVGPGQSPHSYNPTPDQMARLADATVFFCLGLEFEESLLPKIRKSIPTLRIVDMRKGITLRTISTDHHHDGHHNSSSCHVGKDPHIWLSPRLVKQMGETIREALIEVDPQGAKTYEQNLVLFHRDLDSLDSYIRQTLAPLKGTALFVFHPAFGYFADEYGLVQISVETGGKEPSARVLAALIEQAQKLKPKAIFVQPQYARRSAEALAKQIGCAVVPINPLPESYVDEMREMCGIIREGLSANE